MDLNAPQTMFQETGPLPYYCASPEVESDSAQGWMDVLFSQHNVTFADGAGLGAGPTVILVPFSLKGGHLQITELTRDPVDDCTLTSERGKMSSNLQNSSLNTAICITVYIVPGGPPWTSSLSLIHICTVPVKRGLDLIKRKFSSLGRRTNNSVSVSFCNMHNMDAIFKWMLFKSVLCSLKSARREKCDRIF